MSGLAAIRFFYPKRGDRLETIPFYVKRLRELLRRRRGKVCWLVGGQVERPAYLLFKKEIAKEVAELIKEQLASGLSFEMEAVDPEPLLRKYLGQERLVVGYLDLPNGQRLGSPESLAGEDFPVDYVGGFWLASGYEFVRAEHAELRHVKRRDGVEAPMIILEDAVVELHQQDGSVKTERHQTYCVWLSGVAEESLRPEWRELARALKER